MPPRLVSTPSRFSPLTLTASVTSVLSLITLGFFLLILRPVCLAISLNFCVFCWMSWNFKENRTRLFAKYKSSSFVVKFHLISVNFSFCGFCHYEIYNQQEKTQTLCSPVSLLLLPELISFSLSSSAAHWIVSCSSFTILTIFIDQRLSLWMESNSLSKST